MSNNKQVTTQTATVTNVSADHWKSNKGTAELVAFLQDGWTVTLVAGKTMTRTKSIVIPTL